MPQGNGLSAALLAIPPALAVALLIACAGQKGATEQQLAAARQVAGEGATLYQDHCAECHGARGEGQPGVPRVMGPRALPVKVKEKPPDTSQMNDPAKRERLQRSGAIGAGAELRMRFNTAADIFKYATEEHPGISNPVADEEMWGVLTFMLHAHGLKIPPGGITEQNAATIKNEL
jgi:mono/diheme cytochrome c family protein